MFGYVRVYQPELKMGEWEQYRGVYCSLCRRLGRRYGLPARFLLNYDLTLLALFHMALAPDHAGFADGHCSFNPTRRCPVCREQAPLDYAADAAVLMTWYKLKDDVADSGFWRRLTRRPLLWAVTPMKRRAAQLRPQLALQMEEYAAAQRAVEREAHPSVDAAAAPTAALLSALCGGDATGDERYARRRFGYCLGRWIYLIDAVDDWEDDRRCGGFNPFPAKEGQAPREYMRQTLNLCLSECLTAWHLLERRRFDGILQNILQYGMPAEQRRVLEKEKRKGAAHRGRSV